MNATPVPLTVTISGPTYLPDGDDGTFTANPSGGSGTYTNYQWWYRNDEGGSPPPKGGFSPLLPPPNEWIYWSQWEGDQTITFGPDYNFSLKCKVTDSKGNTAEDVHSVIVGGPEPDIRPATANVKLIPKELTLESNYPNPFNPTTKIRFGLPESQKVEISIYDLCGNKVKTLLRDDFSAGYHQIQWDGRDYNGNKLASGIYIYELKTGSKRLTSKMIFAK